MRRLLALALPLLAGCGGDSPPRGAPAMRLDQLAGRAPEAVDSAFGAPASITPVDATAEHGPGEVREYAAAPGTVVVRFQRGEAVFFTVELREAAESAPDALWVTGIDVGGDSPSRSAPLAQWWDRRPGGDSPFLEAGAVKDHTTGLYNVVQAKTR